MRKNNKFYSSLKRGAPTIFTVLGIAGVVAVSYTHLDVYKRQQ